MDRTTQPCSPQGPITVKRKGSVWPSAFLLVLLWLMIVPYVQSAVIQKGAAMRLGGAYTFALTDTPGEGIRWRLDRHLVDEATGVWEYAPAIDSALGASATFALSNWPGKRTEYVVRAHDAGGEDSVRIRVFPAGSVSTFVHQGPNNTGKPVRVFIVVPPQAGPASRVMAVMHGVDRNAQTYIVPWIGFASLRDRIVIAPEFTSVLWPSSRSYNLGNMFTESDTSGSPVPEPQWSFSILQEITRAVWKGFLLTDSLYDIWGHSAGAQFVHRMVLAKPAANIRLAIAANAGSYTVTDTTAVWPYGTRYSLLAMRTAELLAFTRRPLVVMRGTADTVRDSNLDTSPEADAQGLHRYARAETFVTTARMLNPSTPWGFYDVPGIGHDQVAMSSSAQELLGGPWPPPSRPLLYFQSFGTTASLPPGWTTAGIGWSPSTSNGSIRYLGASGGTNLNGSNSGTEVSTLTFQSAIALPAYASIGVRWGARRSTSFTNPMTFEWSPDGVSWSPITYAEVPNTTTWTRVNNGDDIAITAPAAGAPSVGFRWTFTQANNGGAYRLDDFEITANPATNVRGSDGPGLAGTALLCNYPNPFNPATYIPFRLGQKERVRVDVFDILGCHVLCLLDGPLEAGEHRVRADLSRFPSGTYIVRLTTGGNAMTKRMLLLR